jgi:hypothetical protein
MPQNSYAFWSAWQTSLSAARRSQTGEPDQRLLDESEGPDAAMF